MQANAPGLGKLGNIFSAAVTEIGHEAIKS
jgi:hypothetical protein